MSEENIWIPKVAAVLTKDKTTFEILCPYCGKVHEHGAGKNAKAYGHRISHCQAEPKHNVGYELVKPKFRG